MIAPLWRRGWSLVGAARLRTLSLVTFAHGFIAVSFFLQTVLLARILPLAEFGRLTTLLAIATVIEAGVGARGNETALAAYTQLRADDLAGRAALTRRLLQIDFFWSAGIYGLLIVALPLTGIVGADHVAWLMLLMVGSFLSFPWGTTKSYLTVYRGPNAFPPVETAYAACTLFIGVGLTILIGGVGFVIGMICASLTRSLLALRKAGLFPMLMRERPGEAPPEVASSLWALGLTGTVRSGLLNLAGQMDILLLSAASTPAAVGLYRAAKTLAGLVLRTTQPLWFVLKRHVIVGTLGHADNGKSRRMIFLASLGFAALGAAVLPPLLYFSEEIAAFAFGPEYRGAAEAILWLAPGAWVFYAITGWSTLFGTVAKARGTVIGIYLLQVAFFGAIALGMGVTPRSVALALALSQVLVAAGFWLLLLRGHRLPAEEPG